ncbi:hypothetical protein [Streptomyces antimicrobicus]|uniref:Secreted protein n=1 Tax=Streptomyces antimicrobicus TaxID=2883108 RepID=A0ABS8B0P2_9ACTN|nr:hypothetical protein [Streptomyces antimicrobicus]MCB5178182.1 hypothetical protein [Streptomyces antimicrobicus]
MEAALIIFALMLMALVGLAVYATVKVVGVAKRGVERTVTQARRTVEDTTLRAKSLGQFGPAATLAQLRLDLRTSMRATRETLEHGVRSDASLHESLALFERLSAHGRELDEELKRLEQEPDKAHLASRLPDLRDRTSRITTAADSLRFAANDRARRFAEDDLSTLSAQIDLESGALRHWSASESASESATAETGPAGRAGAGSGQAAGGFGPGAGAGAAPPAAGSGSGAASRSAGAAADTPAPTGDQGAQRPALDPARPTPTYPWQKTPRPEATT